MKIDVRNYKKVYFCSDLHIGHDREFLWGKRGFSSVVEHDEFMWAQLESLPQDSVLINLGDCCLTQNQYENALRLSELPYTQYMLWGNHNAGVSRLYKEKKNELNLGSYEHVYPLKVGSIIFAGVDCVVSGMQVSHFTKHTWDKDSKGSIHLHGHQHGGNKMSSPSDLSRKQIDVGVENALKYNGSIFFSLSEVKRISGSKLVSPDHH